MKPTLTLAIGVLLLLQTTGLVAIVAPLPCTDGCPEDGPDGACAPLCDECVCCPTVRSCEQPGFMVGSPQFSLLRRATERRIPSPDTAPADIFHVPKPSPA